MATAAVLVQDCGNPLATTNLFRVGLAQTLDEVIECQRLRSLVFNCELGQGLDSSVRTGLDRDRFDFIYAPLIVQYPRTGTLPPPHPLPPAPPPTANPASPPQ